MIGKPFILGAFASIILGIGAANAAPCNGAQTTGADNGDGTIQEGQRQEQPRPDVAEQAKSGGTTPEPLSLSSTITDTDRLTALPPEGETPAKIVRRDC